MDATTAVAIAGIVVAGFFGPSVAAWWAGRSQGRQHQHERELHDLAELRSVLDDAAERFVRAAVVLTRAAAEYDRALVQSPELRADRSAIREALADEAYSRIHEAQAAGERLEMRVGSDAPVSQEFTHAGNDLFEAAGALLRINTKDDELGRELLSRSDKARRRFVSEAKTLLGSNLPARRTDDV